MQKNRFFDLSVSTNSIGRFNLEKKNILRSPYQRDRDRIIHSTAFRRLKHKTQVFVNTADDHYRTRITHSLEVSQIARTLAKIFRLNEDLCETMTLSDVYKEVLYDRINYPNKETKTKIIEIAQKFPHKERYCIS